MTGINHYSYLSAQLQTSCQMYFSMDKQKYQLREERKRKRREQEILENSKRDRIKERGSGGP